MDQIDEARGYVKCEWRFRCVLKLPWRPVLASSGYTEHEFDDQLKMRRHYEYWNVQPGKAVRMLVTPQVK